MRHDAGAFYGRARKFRSGLPISPALSAGPVGRDLLVVPEALLPPDAEYPDWGICAPVSCGLARPPAAARGCGLVPPGGRRGVPAFKEVKRCFVPTAVKK